MMEEPLFLTLAEVVAIHQDQVERYGGSDGILDSDALISALAQPAATFGKKFLHSDLFIMASAYLYHLVQNHPFVDGNKRTGVAVALVFLDLNGIDIEADADELANLVFEVAQGKAGKEAISAFLKHNRRG
jgi:death on curing protein